MKTAAIYLAISICAYAVTPWAALIIPDSIFGWGAHAACLGLSWIIGPLVTGSMGVGMEYAKIPQELARLRVAMSGKIDENMERQIVGFERFILACGMGHVLRPVVLFVPTLTPMLVAVDFLTLWVSRAARESVRIGTDQMLRVAADRDALEIKVDSLMSELEEARKRRDAALARLNSERES